MLLLLIWLVAETVQNPVAEVTAVRQALQLPPYPFYNGDKYSPALSNYNWADFDDKILFKVSWLTNWHDDTLPNYIPILGTHQSLTYSINSVVGLFAKTQRLTLDQQLYVGVRMFDFRLKFGNDGKLYAFHDILPLNISWDFVWRTLIDFLDNNTGEALFFLVRDESYSNHSAVARAALEQVPVEVRKRFLVNVDFALLTTTSLKELRGKIVVVNYDGNYTVPWADNTNFKYKELFVSDHYSFDVPDQLSAKANYVRDVYLSLDQSHFNIVFDTLANKSLAHSVRWNGINLRRDFQTWRKKTHQSIKGCVIMYDWL